MGVLENIPVVNFVFPAAGSLTCDTLDDNFDIVALAAGFEFNARTRREFMAYREALQALLFP